jgi:hypothetical protein
MNAKAWLPPFWVLASIADRSIRSFCPAEKSKIESRPEAATPDSFTDRKTKVSAPDPPQRSSGPAPPVSRSLPEPPWSLSPPTPP